MLPHKLLGFCLESIHVLYNKLELSITTISCIMLRIILEKKKEKQT